MAAVIYKGSTATLRFKPTNGMTVGNLGTPYVAVSQNRAFIQPTATANTSSNTVTATLTESQTLLLTAGTRARAQMAFKDSTTGNVVRFPIHEIDVKDTIFSSLG